jgi:hypothetical protein
VFIKAQLFVNGALIFCAIPFVAKSNKENRKEDENKKSNKE